MTNHKSWRQFAFNKSWWQFTNQRTSHLLRNKGCTAQDSGHFGRRGRGGIGLVIRIFSLWYWWLWQYWSCWAHIDIIRRLKTTTIKIITTLNVTTMYCHYHHYDYQEQFSLIFIEGKPQSVTAILAPSSSWSSFLYFDSQQGGDGWALWESRWRSSLPHRSNFFLSDQFWHLFLYFDLTFNWLNRSSSILLPYFMREKKFSSVTPISVIQFLSTGTLICWLLAKIFKIQDS